MKTLRLILIFLPLMACYSSNNSIKIKGSDTEVNLVVALAEEFHKVNSDILISVSGGGSGLGIASLLNGNADIANSSRSIKQQEIELFHQKNIELDSFIFAQDAIAFVISDKLTIDSMSVEALAKILSGEYDDWRHFGQKSQPITIYGRQSNSGTHSYLKSVLKIEFSPRAKQMNGNAQILEGVKTDASGIGYVSAGYIFYGGAPQGVKVLSIYDEKYGRAISSLDAESILSKKYLFQRPLLQYFKKSDYPKIKPFFDFEKSATGIKIIQEMGYYPANYDEHKKTPSG